MFKGVLRSHIFRLIPYNPVCILGPWRSKWCFVHNFLPELFFDVFGSRFSFATSTWQPLTFSQYWHPVSWTLTWKRAMPPFQFPLEWLCIDFGTTVNCAKKRFCIWLDHNWSSSFFPNSCFQRSPRYSVEESEGRNDLAVDIYNDENDVDVDVFEDGIDIAMRGARVEMTWRWTQMMRLMTSWTGWAPSDPIFGPTIPDQIFFDRNLQTNLDCSNENVKTNFANKAFISESHTYKSFDFIWPPVHPSQPNPHWPGQQSVEAKSQFFSPTLPLQRTLST